MIERFNFYDVFGYLIPGGTMLTLLVLPYIIVTGTVPEIKPTLIVVLLVAAYLTGHFLHGMAMAALPSKMARDANGNQGYPSDLMLSPKNKAMGQELRKLIARLVLKRFGIALDIETELDLTNADHVRIAKDRNNVFFLCRPIANKTSAYPEQFQSLYVLMQELTVTFLLACAYYLGWVLSAWHNAELTRVSRELLVVAFIASLAIAYRRAFDKKEQHRGLDKAALWVLSALLLTGGEVLAEATAAMLLPTTYAFYVLVAIASFCPVVAFRFYSLYGYFANQFANSVWTYFAAADAEPPAK